ncbi:MAG: ribonuclease HII [Helicobacteraceae bacterium 4484_230]|nr:MAG: ribonuclease HII [Helicobacteraceae bacterium 4484_230]
MMLCGIDEAGRGPIAGPMLMAGVILHCNIEGLGDSKKLTAKRREQLFGEIINNSTFHIVSFSAQQIDEMGISACLNRGLREIMDTVGADNYLFDGNSSFGISGLQTMVKADTKIAEVSAASILAKVTRDREMLKLSEEFPQYDFNRHKGYGTKAHIDAIRKHGYSSIHRKTFKLKALEKTLL